MDIIKYDLSLVCMIKVVKAMCATTDIQNKTRLVKLNIISLIWRDFHTTKNISFRISVSSARLLPVSGIALQ